MYKSFTVRNFRCFTDLKIEALERINLIAGKNDVGKTALLEAFWLHHGANVPDLARRVNAFRGLNEIDMNEPFLELFTDFDPDSVIEMRAHGIWSEKSRTLRIYRQEPQAVEIPVGEPAGLEQTAPDRTSLSVRRSRYQIILEYIDENDKVFKSWGWPLERQIAPGMVELGLLRHEESIGKRPIGIFLPARHRPSGKEDIDRFSYIELTQRQEDIIRILREVDPRVKRLSVIVISGVPIIHADIGTNRLVPVPLIGDGMCRLLSIALAIANAQDGILLVDEIENGLYYGVMVDVWKAIAAFTRQFNVQLFATTHSEECIRSAHQAFTEDSKYDFHLHRLERIENTIRAVTYEKETLGAALEAGLEVR